MECALTLARRGAARVRLVERAPAMGGHLGLLTRLPGLAEWGRVTAYRMAALKRLPNVELVNDRELTGAEIAGDGASAVVLATGSQWAADGLNAFTRAPIPGAEAAAEHVLTPEQIVLGGRRPPGRVVVYDGDGYLVGAALAELLAREGREVEFVTGYATVAPFCAETLEDVLIRARLHDCGVVMRTGTVLTGIAPGLLTCTDADGEPLELAAAGVVLVTQRVSHDALYHELDGRARARLPHRRLRRAAAARRGDLRRPPAGARDRRRRSRGRAALPARARRRQRRAAGRRRAGAAGRPSAARAARAARVRHRRTRGSQPRASTRCCAPPGWMGSWPSAPARATRSIAADAWPSVTAPASPSRARRSRPAARPRAELVGASGATVAPRAYVAIGISGALPHLVGMSGSGTVVAVNRDRGARIFEYADLGIAADAGG